MEDYIAVVKSTGGKLDKYQDFSVEADAVNHVETYGGFVAPDPGGQTNYWIVDEVAKTVTNNQDQADADALASSWANLRSERNALLASSDWIQYNDSPLTNENKASWAKHRQELRDLPAVTTDPADPTWPEAPK